MKKFGIDWHSMFGAGCVLGTMVMTQVNQGVALVAGCATALYMTLRACREYVRLRRELDTERNYESKNKKNSTT
jgi:hypothetical protein